MNEKYTQVNKKMSNFSKKNKLTEKLKIKTQQQMNETVYKLIKKYIQVSKTVF